MKQNKILSMLGLAMRARKVVSGELQATESVKKGTCMLMLVAQDASANTKKLFINKCSFYGVPIYEYGTKETLGRAIGKDYRSSLGVCDEGLADAIIKLLKQEGINDCAVSIDSEYEFGAEKR